MEWLHAVVQCTQGNILSRLYNIAAQPAHSAVMYTFVHIVSKQKQATKLCFSWKCSVGACEEEKCLLISHQPEYYLCTSVICISPCIETSVPLKVKIKYHLDWEVCIQFTSTSKNVKLFKYPFSQFESVLYCPCFKCQIIMFHISKLLISTFICY